MTSTQHTGEPTRLTAATFVDHVVVDAGGHEIGTVTDVIYDDMTNTPAWFVVDPGLLRKERYVPIDRSYTADNGHIVVPFDKRWVKTAEKANRDHILTGDVEAALDRHYGTDHTHHDDA